MPDFGVPPILLNQIVSFSIFIDDLATIFDDLLLDHFNFNLNLRSILSIVVEAFLIDGKDKTLKEVFLHVILLLLPLDLVLESLSGLILLDDGHDSFFQKSVSQPVDGDHLNLSGEANSTH